MTIEGFRLRALKKYLIATANMRNAMLKHKDFTIISNNCWGGIIYESYNLPKLSPTVGLFFMASEYIKFLSNLEYYLNTDLTFISPDESRYAEWLKKDKRFGSYPVGLVDDVEIEFLHYTNECEAYDKWMRRVKRVNRDKMLVKFNDQNLCTVNDVQKFMQIPIKNKLFFTVRDWGNNGIPCGEFGGGYYQIKQLFNHESITPSHEVFGNSITKLINKL